MGEEKDVRSEEEQTNAADVVIRLKGRGGARICLVSLDKDPSP